jgi:hypothetical protein
MMLSSANSARCLLDHGLPCFLCGHGLRLNGCHGLLGHLCSRLGVHGLELHGGLGDGVQLLLHARNLELALAEGGLGSAQLSGVKGGHVDICNLFQDVIASIPGYTNMSGVPAT